MLVKEVNETVALMHLTTTHASTASSGGGGTSGAERQNICGREKGLIVAHLIRGNVWVHDLNKATWFMAHFKNPYTRLNTTLVVEQHNTTAKHPCPACTLDDSS